MHWPLICWWDYFVKYQSLYSDVFAQFQPSWTMLSLQAVCPSVTKCTIMYCEQTAEPTSINFCAHMHADTVHLHTNFHPNRQRPWPSFSNQRFKFWSSYVIILQTVTDRTNIVIANKHEATCGLLICHISAWPCPIINSRSRSCTFQMWISWKQWQIGQTLLLPTNRMSHKTFQLAYLNLNLNHSKGQGQGHAHFVCKYLWNDDRANIILPSNMKSNMSFRLIYLDLTFAHSKC